MKGGNSHLINRKELRFCKHCSEWGLKAINSAATGVWGRPRLTLCKRYASYAREKPKLDLASTLARDYFATWIHHECEYSDSVAVSRESIYVGLQ